MIVCGVPPDGVQEDAYSMAAPVGAGTVGF